MFKNILIVDRILHFGLILAILLATILHFTGTFSNEIQEQNRVKYLTYNEISTSVDERGRLHILDISNGNTIIFSDTVSFGIHAQVSNIIINNFKEKIK